MSSNTISVFLIMVRLLSRKGLFGKLLANVVVSLMKSFINVGLSSWYFCFFSCAVEDSTFSNSSVIQQGSALHNSHLTIAELSCRLMREVAPLALFMHLFFCLWSWSNVMWENCLLVFKSKKFPAANSLYLLGQRCLNNSISNQ